MPVIFRQNPYLALFIQVFFCSFVPMRYVVNEITNQQVTQ
uniref:Uncharacterized protein n=1 Tax=Chlorobium phaeobacteroides (strain BS1) TaxID=331678 RepID=B3EM36_CHLPB